jgi:hypothetical protein
VIAALLAVLIRKDGWLHVNVLRGGGLVNSGWNGIHGQPGPKSADAQFRGTGEAAERATHIDLHACGVWSIRTARK